MNKCLADDLTPVARDLLAIAFLVRAFLALSALDAGDNINPGMAAMSIVELLCASMLVLGWRVTAASLVLASMTLISAACSLGTEDPEVMVHLLKDFALAGGLLQIAAFANPSGAVDAAGETSLPGRPERG